MDGVTVGVFDTDQQTKTSIETALAKKSEAEGIVVYRRTESGHHISFLDTFDFPDRIQGYARIASIADHEFYVYPSGGRLSSADGELAVLLQSFGLEGTLEVLDGKSRPEDAKTALRDTAIANYPVDERITGSGVLKLEGLHRRADLLPSGTLVYIDRVFPVKGVGTVALGFMLCGEVAIHDELRPVPGLPDV